VPLALVRLFGLVSSLSTRYAYRFHKCGCRQGCPNSVLEGGRIGGRQGPRVANIINTNRVTRRQNGGQFLVGGHELRVIFQPQQYVSRGRRDCSGLLTFSNYQLSTGYAFGEF